MLTIKICKSSDPKKINIVPSGPLGGKFNSFRIAVAIGGGTWTLIDGNRAPIGKLAKMVEALQSAGFVLDLDPDLGPAVPATVTRPSAFTRPAATPIEFWAQAGLNCLCGATTNRKKILKGFSRPDLPIGHTLYNRLCAVGGLSNQEWATLIRILPKYKNQIGDVPGSASLVSDGKKK